ncbi:MAG: TIM barrel protein [Candidatus Helarchaeota archaeon]|nr:TIM barrel protein [Candidatus Helarchaeota archaeon]
MGPAAYPTIKIANFYDMIDLCQKNQYSALELEFVRITTTEYPASKTLEELAKYAKQKNVSLSVHGSLYINLAAIADNKINLAKEHIRQGVRIAKAASANLIFHAGYFQKLAHDAAIQKAIVLLNSLEIPADDCARIFLETPGKLNSIGSLPELLQIAEQTHVQIGIDWGHYYARSKGKSLKETDEILEVLGLLEKEIDQKYFHMHISGIEFTQKGEKRHLSFTKSEFPLELVIQAFQNVGYAGTLICESPRRWKGDTDSIQQLIQGKIIRVPRKKLGTLDDYIPRKPK